MIVVIGAGISGLATAYYLRKYGLEVVLLEADDHSGGKIQTVRHKDFLLERGPASLRIDNAETHALISDLGLDNRVVLASDSAKTRYILLDRKLRQVPASVMKFVTSPLLSVKAKLRMLKEPFIPSGVGDDEPLDDFVRRRLGAEPAARLIDPMVSGIYAGDARSLSTRSAFPMLWAADQDHHSIARGMMKTRRGKKKVRKQIVNFQNGMHELTRSLMVALGSAYVHSTPVRGIRRHEGGFLVQTESKDYQAWQVVLSTPASVAAELISELDPQLSSMLQRVKYPRVALVHLGFRADQFEEIPNGFGFLVPSSENKKLLGCIYNSSTFAGRAPEGSILLTVVLGGALSDPEEAWEEEQIAGVAVKELRTILNFTGEPTLASATIWPNAIPQYDMDHPALVEAIRDTEAAMPGLHFRANYVDGIALGACIRNSVQLADQIAAEYSEL